MKQVVKITVIYKPWNIRKQTRHRKVQTCYLYLNSQIPCLISMSKETAVIIKGQFPSQFSLKFLNVGSYSFIILLQGRSSLSYQSLKRNGEDVIVHVPCQPFAGPLIFLIYSVSASYTKHKFKVTSLNGEDTKFVPWDCSCM